MNVFKFVLIFILVIFIPVSVFADWPPRDLPPLPSCAKEVKICPDDRNPQIDVFHYARSEANDFHVQFIGKGKINSSAPGTLLGLNGKDMGWLDCAVDEKKNIVHFKITKNAFPWPPGVWRSLKVNLSKNEYGWDAIRYVMTQDGRNIYINVVSLDNISVVLTGNSPPLTYGWLIPVFNVGSDKLYGFKIEVCSNQKIIKYGSDIKGRAYLNDQSYMFDKPLVEGDEFNIYFDFDSYAESVWDTEVRIVAIRK